MTFGAEWARDGDGRSLAREKRDARDTRPPPPPPPVQGLRTTYAVL
jgi:hypothetical protein